MRRQLAEAGMGEASSLMSGSTNGVIQWLVKASHLGERAGSTF